MHRRSTCVAGRPLHRDDAASALVDRLQDGVRPGVEPAAGVLPPSRQVYPTARGQRARADSLLHLFERLGHATGRVGLACGQRQAQLSAQVVRVPRNAGEAHLFELGP